MKKIAALMFITGILVITFGFVITACGDNSSGDPTSPSTRPGDTSDNPITRTENRQLTPSAWVALLNEIETGGKYVELDLSACTPGSQSSGGGLWIDGTFNADPVPVSNLNNIIGKDKIVSLILPEAASSIAERFLYIDNNGLPVYEKCFLYFRTLKSITGINITAIGRNAFAGLGTYNGHNYGGCLTSINFPKVQTIGRDAFSGCYSLISANIPEVQIIGDQAFLHTDLQSLYIPKVEYIGVQAFGSTKPARITLGAIAPIVDRYMFALTWKPRSVTVMVPQNATGYGVIPSDYIGGDIAKNWGNAVRGMGWNPSSVLS
jgi:hypothetical protein